MNTATSSLLFPRRALRLYTGFSDLIDKLQPLFALALRIYIFRVFFWSGLTKIRSWDSTLALFTNEYHVPTLPPEIAAVLGTAAELGLPLLLLAGLGTRFTALALFVFNIVAVVSHPDLTDAGIKDHVLWGALLLVTLFYGPGKLALDRWINKRSHA